MKPEFFRTLSIRDFENGATIDEIYLALKDLDNIRAEFKSLVEIHDVLIEDYKELKKKYGAFIASVRDEINCTHLDMGGFEKSTFHVSSTGAKRLVRKCLDVYIK